MRLNTKSNNFSDIISKIDYSSPQAKGLVAFWPLNNFSGSVASDLVSNNNGTLSNASWVTSQAGKVLSFNGTTSSVNLGNATYIYSNAAFTISLKVFLNSFTQNYPEPITLRTNTTYPLEIALSNQAGYLGITFGSGSNWFCGKNGVASNTYVNVWTHIVLTYNGLGASTSSNFTLYVNGQSSALSASSAYATQSQKSILGGSTGSSYNLFSGLISDVRIYNRAITLSEARDIYYFPNLIYLKRRKILTSSSSASNSYTLTANSSSFSLTGQNASLLFGHILISVQGSFSLTDQSATLRSIRSLPCTQGSFSHNGQSANLYKGISLSCEHGTFTLTAQNNAFAKGFGINCVQGSFSLNGQSAVLSATRILTSAQGSFSLSGQNANLRKGIFLECSNGTFTLTGQDADLYHNYTLSCDNGLFSLTGQSASLRKSGGSGGSEWDELLENHIEPGTFGYHVQKLLTLAKYMGLK